MEVDGVYIDPASVEILRRLVDAPRHRSNTSQMKEHLARYDLGNRESVKYRFRKLEDAGLVDVTDPGLDERGRRLPLRVQLTETGRDVVDELDVDGDDRDGEGERDDETEAAGDDVDAAEVIDAVRVVEEGVDDVEDDLQRLRDVYQRQIRGRGDYTGVLPALHELDERVERIETGIVEELGAIGDDLDRRDVDSGE